jgi:RHS repeat-associated protein
MGETFFIHSDWQGTERVRSAYTGASYETCINTPYGDNLSCAGGIDVSPMHYTGKQRDTETNLDYLGAHYYSSGMARWMSPDWADKPTTVPYANFGDPQSLEGADALEKDEEGASFDSGIIGAALRTEHYEIAGYTAAIAMAETLKLSEITSLLTENLNEEVAAAKKILGAAQPILSQSATEPEAKKEPKSGKEKYSAKKSKEDEQKAAPDLRKRSA